MYFIELNFVAAKKYHPDTSHGQGPSANRFREVSEAWGILSRPELRKEYDSARRTILGDTASEIAASFPVNPIKTMSAIDQVHSSFATRHKATYKGWDGSGITKFKADLGKPLTLEQRKVRNLITLLLFP